MAISGKTTSLFGNEKVSTISEYHRLFPESVADKLQQMREAIISVAPDAEEVISYNMPAFKMGSVLVYYAAYKNHIGFYPTSRPMIVFADLLVKYKTSKGAIQFPINEKVPLALIKKIVKFRIREVVEKNALKKVAKKTVRK